MEESASREAFNRFQPLCVQLTREHSLANVSAVTTALQQPIQPGVLQQLQEYVLFPLRLILKQSTNKCENLYIAVLRCQTDLLNKTEISHTEMFQDIFTSLCITLSSNDPSNKVKAVSEELKLAVVLCLSATTRSTTSSVLQQVYRAEFLPALGHAVSLLLHLVACEGMRELRMASITCLQDLALFNRKVTAKLQDVTADMFASFLPGISMAMTTVSTGDTKQGHLITKTAIETWYKVVTLVIGDKSLTSAKKCDVKIDTDKPYQKLIISRTPKWVTMTTEKLKILITKMATLTNHSNWRVRLVMVHWADNLLQKCTKSLEYCVSEFLEILVSLVGDEYDKVSLTSRHALSNFQQMSLADSKPLVEILESNLHDLATRLPTLIRTSDDSSKHSSLGLFCGYLRLLGPHMGNLLRSYSHLQHISTALLQLLQLDTTGLTIIQERTPALPLHEREDSYSPFKLRKTFKHFTEEKIQKDLIYVCRLFGYYGDLDLLVDHFLEKFMQSSYNRKQAAFILNEILIGYTGEDVAVDIPRTTDKDKKHLYTIVRSLIDEYLQPEHWNLVTSNQPIGSTVFAEKGADWQIVSANQKPRYGLTVEQINSNILQICLQLEGLANAAKVLGVEFQPLLIDVLYPVLEKLGDDNLSVSQSSYTTLCLIAQACQYNSVEQLLYANADYLVNAISLRLRHLVSHPHAPLVLKVTVTYSNQDILPLLDDTIVEMLESLDSHYGERAVLFLSVLHALITSICKWYPSSSATTQIVSQIKKNSNKLAQKQTSQSSSDNSATAGASCAQLTQSLNKKANRTTVKDIRTYFVDYIKQKQLSETLDDDITQESSVDDDAEAELNHTETDEKKPPPKHVSLVMQVMERCIHLVAAPDPRLRLLVLDTITQCVTVLADHQDQLLPLVHKVWPPFVLRFTDEEQQVIIKAFQVLRVLGETSGDFIRQRVVKDVIPKLTMLLHKLAPTSERVGPAYRFTVACRLQLSILHNIGPLCHKIRLSEQQIGPVLQATLPYLSSKQHPALQQAAVEAWLLFAEQDPDCVWFLLHNVYSPEALVPPHPCFIQPKLCGSTKRNEFTVNIQKLLDVL